MKTTRINEGEIAAAAVSSLPTRPTATRAFGGGGMTAEELKAAFDKLPRLIIERFNALLDDVVALGDGSLADAIPTGILGVASLAVLFSDITDGNFATYLDVGGESLATAIARIKERVGL